MLFPMDIEVNPRTTVIASETGAPRRVYTDGRLHPKDALPSTTGHSIGYWKNNELFIDTCCVKDTVRLPGNGRHSDEMHITEHLWSPSPTVLKDEITVEDPKAFAAPWKTVKTYYRRPDWEPVEHDGDDNERDFPHDVANASEFKPAAKSVPANYAPPAKGWATPPGRASRFRTSSATTPASNGLPPPARPNGTARRRPTGPNPSANAETGKNHEIPHHGRRLSAGRGDAGGAGRPRRLLESQ